MTHQVVPDRSQGGTDGRLLGPYRLSRRLASGGLSAVFLATDTRDDSQVAVKVFKPEVNHNPELVWLSERSLAVTRQLDHPNLIKILDGGVHDERRYSVMEYVAGGRTLAQELAEGPLSLSRGLSVLRQVLEAIDAIHCAGMAHRDIKPDNILLVPHNDGPQVKILDLDFLGPIGHRRLARVREILGTPKYMAPEEIHRGYPHPRGDLFSLGVTAYELFSGQEPFKVDKEVGYLYANRFQSHEPLTRLRPDLPESVGRFVGHLLARQPGERYDSGTALHDCLILENACGSPAGVFSSAPVGLVGPPRIRHWSTQLASLWTAAALLPLAFGLLWLASGERPMAVPFADATEPLRVSKQAPPSRPAPVAPWPQWQVRTASTPQNRAWQKARLSEENGSPESRKTAITLLNDIAADSGHPHYEEACALLARLQEIEFLRLRRSQPVRALACLTAARNATRDNQLRHRLSSEIAKFEKHLASQELASKAPEGFVLCPGKPAVFISRRLGVTSSIWPT